MDVTTNIEKGNVGEIQVIIEQNAVTDCVYQGNIRQENLITVDKKAPKLENYTINKGEDGKIIVDVTYDEALSLEEKNKQEH